MRTVFLMVSVSVEYPALLSAMGCVGDVGFILTLKGQVFSSNLYKVCMQDCERKSVSPV